MKVIAKRTGFYDNKRIYEGQSFILHDKKMFSEKWMEPADGKAKPKAKTEPKVKVESKVEDVI